MGNDLILEEKERLIEVRSILVSQPKPADEKSPYYSLAEKYGIKIDFRPFIKIDPVDIREFRKQKVNFLDLWYI